MARIKGPSAKRRKISATAAAAGSDGSDGAAAAANGSDGSDGAAAAFVPTVQCLGDDILTVQCLDGFMLVDNARLAAMTSSSDDIPRVLFHLLQIRTGGFKAETSGSVDLRCYGIKREHLSNIIAFIRTGVLPLCYPEKVEEMQQAFERLGGWDRFDSIYLKRQNDANKHILRMKNPQTSGEDILSLFYWCPPNRRPRSYVSSSDPNQWEETAQYTHSTLEGRVYWKRRRKAGDAGDFEVKYCALKAVLQH